MAKKQREKTWLDNMVKFGIDHEAAARAWYVKAIVSWFDTMADKSVRGAVQVNFVAHEDMLQYRYYHVTRKTAVVSLGVSDREYALHDMPIGMLRGLANGLLKKQAHIKPRFKEGDKVCIPTSKHGDRDWIYQEFADELKRREYGLPYLLVESVGACGDTPKYGVSLKRANPSDPDNDTWLDRHAFYEDDLMPYKAD